MSTVFRELLRLVCSTGDLDAGEGCSLGIPEILHQLLRSMAYGTVKKGPFAIYLLLPYNIHPFLPIFTPCYSSLRLMVGCTKLRHCYSIF